jgi:hypothetical protein
MNKTIKFIILLAGLVVTLYGIYQIISPEASVDIGIAEFESQDNKNSFITTGFGIVLLLIGLLVKKK